MRTDMSIAYKVRENRARRWAGRLGYRLHRSKVKRVHADDFGQYRLALGDAIVIGARNDADLARIEAYLAEAERALVAERRAA